MARFDHLKGVFGLLPTPYGEDFEILMSDLRAEADFCCRSGQHGIVWPVMVGEFQYVGEEERIRGWDAVMDEVNGRLPVVFGCSGISVPQVMLYARAAQKANADAVIAMTPAGTDQAIAMDLYRRLADNFDGPIIVQNASMYAPLNGEQIAQLVDEVPQIEYVKEERPPGPKHITEVYELVGDKVKTIFGGSAGRFLPDELNRGADGNMPACEIADLIAKVQELWWAGDQAGARAMHTRLLPLINLETQPFMRYMLKRRGVVKSLVERAPAGPKGLTAEDKAEIAVQVDAIADLVESYPFGPE